MSIWERFINNVQLRRIVVLALIIAILVAFKGMMSMILLTFIFTLIVVKLSNLVSSKTPIPRTLVVVVVYVLILVGLFITITDYLPQLLDQTISSTKDMVTFYSNPKNLPDGKTMGWINYAIQKAHLMDQVQNGVSIVWHYVTSVGAMGLTLFLSLILSFFYAIEQKTMADFSKEFLTSDISWFFSDIYFFGKKFVGSFGVVIEAQFFIAIVNTVITTIVMYFMHLPELAVLSIMIFILSLVPVAGVIISLIPLSLVAYSVGGFTDVLYIWLMILAVHTLEAYVLNPKFMSSRTNLPIFYTFVVLLVAEHFFGTWGLICGVPIFTFFLDITGVQTTGQSPTKGITDDIPK